MKILLVIGLLISVCYILYQFFRNEAVYRIRMNWMHNRDSRHDKYTYSEMYKPSLKNYFGIRYPKDKHFK